VNTRYRDEIDDYQASGEREINLNAATIVGIFFLLALICGVFFAFGYNLGRKSAPSPTAETLAAPSQVVVSTAPKPAPGSRAATAPEVRPDTVIAHPSVAAADTPSEQVAQPAEPPRPSAAATTSQSITIPIAPKPEPAAPRRATAAAPVTSSPVARPAALPPPATFMVQIAAVSHQEDADVLQTALERRGYHITIVHVPQDKLQHVQVGPFATRKDAEDMRQRLLNDGYNAIVK